MVWWYPSEKDKMSHKIVATEFIFWFKFTKSPKKPPNTFYRWLYKFKTREKWFLFHYWIVYTQKPFLCSVQT